MNKQQIQDEVAKTMSILDASERAAANPFLYTRVEAALQQEEKNFWSRAFSFISRPAISVAAIAIAIMINAVVYLESRSEPRDNTQEEEVFASEYNLSTNTIYDATIDQR